VTPVKIVDVLLSNTAIGIDAEDYALMNWLESL